MLSQVVRYTVLNEGNSFFTSDTITLRQWQWEGTLLTGWHHPSIASAKSESLLPDRREVQDCQVCTLKVYFTENGWMFK